MSLSIPGLVIAFKKFLWESPSGLSTRSSTESLTKCLVLSKSRWPVRTALLGTIFDRDERILTWSRACRCAPSFRGLSTRFVVIPSDQPMCRPHSVKASHIPEKKEGGE